jgi:hypothetical protein
MKKDLIVRKAFDIETKVADDSRGEVDIIISSDIVDRDREQVVPTGIVLPEPRRVPLVAGHGHTDLRKQIGEIVSAGPSGRTVVAKARYFVGKGNPEADWAWTLVKEGVAAYSIGFIPLEVEDADRRDEQLMKAVQAGQAPIRKYKRWELVEVSQVIVPSNKMALQMLREGGVITPSQEAALVAKGVSDRPLDAEVRKTIGRLITKFKGISRKQDDGERDDMATDADMNGENGRRRAEDDEELRRRKVRPLDDAAGDEDVEDDGEEEDEEEGGEVVKQDDAGDGEEGGVAARLLAEAIALQRAHVDDPASATPESQARLLRLLLDAALAVQEEEEEEVPEEDEEAAAEDDAAAGREGADDVLKLFGKEGRRMAKAKIVRKDDQQAAQEVLAAGHARRIGEALEYIGRGSDVLKVLLNEAAAGPGSETPLYQDHDELSAAGPGGAPKSLRVEGEVVVDADDFVARHKAMLDAWRKTLIEELTALFEVQLKKADKTLALPPNSAAFATVPDLIEAVMDGVRSLIEASIAKAVADPKAYRRK